MGEADPSQPFHLTQEDKNVLDMTDEEYTLLDWEFVRHVIGALTSPSELLSTDDMQAPANSRGLLGCLPN